MLLIIQFEHGRTGDYRCAFYKVSDKEEAEKTAKSEQIRIDRLGSADRIRDCVVVEGEAVKWR